MSKLKSLSWGVGLQSTTLLEMSLSGDLPKLDVAIFADTGYEHDHSYETYEFYAPRAIKAGIQVIKISGQDIYHDTYHKVSLPLFVEGTDRMIKRKCTRDYKIRPIHRKIRDILGVNRRGRLKANLVDLWLGISLDEWERAKDSRVKFINHHFPLLDLRMTRQDCAAYLRAKNLPVPGKSSCQFCPYQKISEWSKKSGQELNLIADLEQHINENGLVKIGGQRKRLSFLPFESLLQADLSPQKIGDQGQKRGVEAQKKRLEINGLCDGGFCDA